jgi:hypothetical protein
LSNRIRNEIFVEGKQMFKISQHTGLASVFQTSLAWLDRERTLPRDCSLSWDELYTSLCVTDPASPGLPLCVLSLMWGMCAESAQEVCQTFVSLSLATLSAGHTESRTVNLHDLQLQYCCQQCARAGSPSRDSARFSVLGCDTWHRRVIEGLLAVQASPVDTDDATNIVAFVTAFDGFQTRAVTADAVVQAFLGIVAPDSALGDYFLKNLVRHLWGYDK